MPAARRSASSFYLYVHRWWITITWNWWVRSRGMTVACWDRITPGRCHRFQSIPCRFVVSVLLCAVAHGQAVDDSKQAALAKLGRAAADFERAQYADAL